MKRRVQSSQNWSFASVMVFGLAIFDLVLTIQKDTIQITTLPTTKKATMPTTKHATMSHPEPTAAKKAKHTGWEDHKLNCSEALVKSHEGIHLNEISKSEISTLQGIGDVHAGVLEHLGVKTVGQLAKYKYFLVARGIKTLSEVETKQGRLKGTVMNIDNCIINEAESKSFADMVASPLHILEGLTTKAEDLFATLGVKTVGDLAEFKYCRWAEAIVELSKHEEGHTDTERKMDRELKRLL
jgi:predicted flap endonuclease-1-like 5' DNA nuclease